MPLLVSKLFTNSSFGAVELSWLFYKKKNLLKKIY